MGRVAATVLDPRHWRAHLNAGIMLARLGRVSEALPMFEAAARLRPDDPDVLRMLEQARSELASARRPHMPIEDGHTDSGDR